MASFFYNSTSGLRYSPAERQIEVDGRIYVNPSEAVLADLGYEEVVIQQRPDDRFYIVSGPDDAGVYTSTERSLEDTGSGDDLVKGLRSVYIENQKAAANENLSKTDWYIVREAENATAVPAAVSAHRTEVRSVCAANEALIAGAADFDAFVALVNTPEKLLDADGVTWIENPAAHLSSLPEQPSV